MAPLSAEDQSKLDKAIKAERKPLMCCYHVLLFLCFSSFFISISFISRFILIENAATAAILASVSGVTFGIVSISALSLHMRIEAQSIQRAQINEKTNRLEKIIPTIDKLIDKSNSENKYIDIIKIILSVSVLD